MENDYKMARIWINIALVFLVLSWNDLDVAFGHPTPQPEGLNLIKTEGLVKANDNYDSETYRTVRYENLLVKVDDGVEENDFILRNLEHMLKDAARILYSASTNSVLFGDILISVPENWISESTDDVHQENYLNPHVYVSPHNPLYGHIPYTQQPGGCGEQGLYIHLTPEYLTNMNTILSVNRLGPPGRVFAHEWAHLRYGVFDEFVEQWPDNFYLKEDSEELMASTCPSDVRGWIIPQHNPISSNSCNSTTLDGLPPKECLFYPDIEQTTKGSIMSLINLNQSDFFCGTPSVPHNSEAPTPHNKYCGARSVWDVVKANKDFGCLFDKSGFDSNDSVPYREPQIMIIKRQSKPKQKLTCWISCEEHEQYPPINNDYRLIISKHETEFDIQFIDAYICENNITVDSFVQKLEKLRKIEKTSILVMIPAIDEKIKEILSKLSSNEKDDSGLFIVATYGNCSEIYLVGRSSGVECVEVQKTPEKLSFLLSPKFRKVEFKEILQARIHVENYKSNYSNTVSLNPCIGATFVKMKFTSDVFDEDGRAVAPSLEVDFTLKGKNHTEVHSEHSSSPDLTGKLIFSINCDKIVSGEFVYFLNFMRNTSENIEMVVSFHQQIDKDKTIELTTHLIVSDRNRTCERHSNCSSVSIENIKILQDHPCRRVFLKGIMKEISEQPINTSTTAVTRTKVFLLYNACLKKPDNNISRLMRREINLKNLRNETMKVGDGDEMELKLNVGRNRSTVIHLSVCKLPNDIVYDNSTSGVSQDNFTLVLPKLNPDYDYTVTLNASDTLTSQFLTKEMKIFKPFGNNRSSSEYIVKMLSASPINILVDDNILVEQNILEIIKIINEIKRKYSESIRIIGLYSLRLSNKNEVEKYDLFDPLRNTATGTKPVPIDKYGNEIMEQLQKGISLLFLTSNESRLTNISKQISRESEEQQKYFYPVAFNSSCTLLNNDSSLHNPCWQILPYLDDWLFYLRSRFDEGMMKRVHHSTKTLQERVIDDTVQLKPCEGVTYITISGTETSTYLNNKVELQLHLREQSTGAKLKNRPCRNKAIHIQQNVLRKVHCTEILGGNYTYNITHSGPLNMEYEINFYQPQIAMELNSMYLEVPAYEENIQENIEFDVLPIECEVEFTEFQEYWRQHSNESNYITDCNERDLSKKIQSYDNCVVANRTTSIGKEKIIPVNDIVESVDYSENDVRLVGILKYGGKEPVLGMNVRGKILKDGSLITTLTLHDDGTAGDRIADDGVYSSLISGLSVSGGEHTFDVVVTNSHNSRRLIDTGDTLEFWKVVTESEAVSSIYDIEVKCYTETFNEAILRVKFSTADEEATIIGNLKRKDGNEELPVSLYVGSLSIVEAGNLIIPFGCELKTVRQHTQSLSSASPPPQSSTAPLVTYIDNPRARFGAPLPVFSLPIGVKIEEIIEEERINDKRVSFTTSVDDVRIHDMSLRLQVSNIHQISTDITPPSRVTDLEVTVKNYLEPSVVLTWISAGDDHYTGIASRLDIRYSHNHRGLLRDFGGSKTIEEEKEVLKGDLVPQMGGVRHTVRIYLPEATDQKSNVSFNLHFALVTIDESDNKSFLSNVATARFTASARKKILEMKKTAGLFPLVIKCVLSLAFLVVIIIVVMVKVKQYRNAKKNDLMEFSTDSSTGTTCTYRTNSRKRWGGGMK